MAQDVTLTVRSQLLKIIEELDKIDEKNREVSKSFEDLGKKAGDGLNAQTKQVEGYFSRMRGMVSRIGSQMADDFKALISVNALTESIKLSNQFRGSLRETVSLSDSVRKFGQSFGFATHEFSRLQKALTDGMGEIGASSEEAADVLRGLAGTGVRGESQIVDYSKTATQLASLGGERGKAGDIGTLLAGVVRAQGRSVNDTGNMRAVAAAATKVMEATGKSASQVLSEMQGSFEQMPKELRQRFTPEAVSQISVAGAVAGPAAMEPLKKFMSMSKEQRMGMEAQGFGKIFGKGGELDLGGLKDVAKELKSRGVSARLAAETMGFQGAEAEGLVRLIDNADLLSEALERTKNASDDYANKFRKTLTLQEAFNANLNKVKSIFSGPLTAATQGLTNVLSGASESTGGALAATAGAGMLGAILAGGGLRGIGGALGLGGMAKSAGKSAAFEAITGRKVQDVNVVNAQEVGEAVSGGSAAGSLLTKAVGVGGLLKGAAGVGLAGTAGYALGTAANVGIEKFTQGTTAEGFEGNIIERLIFKMDQLMGGESAARINRAQKVMVELNTRELKISKQPARGASQ